MGLKASIMDPGRCMERVFGLIEVRRVHTWAVPFPEVPRYILEPWDCGKGGGGVAFYLLFHARHAASRTTSQTT